VVVDRVRDGAGVAADADADAVGVEEDVDEGMEDVVEGRRAPDADADADADGLAVDVGVDGVEPAVDLFATTPGLLDLLVLALALAAGDVGVEASDPDPYGTGLRLGEGGALDTEAAESDSEEEEEDAVRDLGRKKKKSVRGEVQGGHENENEGRGQREEGRRTKRVREGKQTYARKSRIYAFRRARGGVSVKVYPDATTRQRQQTPDTIHRILLSLPSQDATPAPAPQHVHTAGGRRWIFQMRPCVRASKADICA
jgi:hypothetical protein